MNSVPRCRPIPDPAVSSRPPPTPAPGSTLQTAELTVQLTQSAQSWYQSDPSKPFGSQFTLTQQFNVQGSTTDISSVTVTLTNGQGTSQAATANFQ